MSSTAAIGRIDQHRPCSPRRRAPRAWGRAPPRCAARRRRRRGARPTATCSARRWPRRSCAARRRRPRRSRSRPALSFSTCWRAFLRRTARSRSTRSRTACASATMSRPRARASSSSASASSRMRSRSRWPSSRSAWACSAASSRIRAAASSASALRRSSSVRAPLEQRIALGDRLGAAPIGLLDRLGLHLGGLGGGVTDDPLGGGVGLGADLRRGLAGGGEDARGLLAEDLDEHGVVGVGGHAQAGLGPLGPLAQLAAFALEALDEGRHLVQEGPHLLLLVAPPAHREGVASDVVAVERVGHGTPMLGPTPGCGRGRPPAQAAVGALPVQQRAHVAAERFERLQRLVEGVDGDDLRRRRRRPPAPRRARRTARGTPRSRRRARRCPSGRRRRRGPPSRRGPSCRSRRPCARRSARPG